VAYEIRNAIEELGEMVIPEKRIIVIKKDPDDNRILECALAADADLIISGDNHLLELMKYKNIQIVSPSEFFEKY
jgi:putative PIN family toxin of toxin-antitoxin system